jgi:hypothetical protein
MYVTRRLLRSTMPAEPTREKEEPFLPPPTPKRRAAVRASAKICEVVTDAAGPAVRSRAAKTSPRQTENGGDEKNKSRNKKKTKKESQMQQEDEAPAEDASSLHGYQLMVDVHYRGEQYMEARILDLDPHKELLFVHYMGWNARFDAWVPVDEVTAHGSHSGAAKKKDAGWDGETPLFATTEEAAAHKQNGKAKTKTKKRPAMSPKARHAARKALRSVSSDRKRHSDEVAETEEAQPPAKRVVRKSPKAAKKSTAKSPRAKKGSTKAASSPARRTPRRVQVAVGTTDEASERKNDGETADLVLDVEVEGRDVSNDEDFVEEAVRAEAEASSGRTKKRATKAKSKTRSKEAAGDAKRKRDGHDEAAAETASAGVKRSPANKSKKPKKAGGKAASKPAAHAKTASPPPPSRRGGLGSATREKLAAIFRLRVQQRQQLEQLNASQASFQESLQDQAEDTATAATADTASASAGETESENAAVANAELAAAEEYQRQLHQYYYHQQVMLANSMQVANNLAMNASSCEDPSSIPLQGGIMDPRIIQERLTALEERRRQQAHVQAYYQQLMLTRERNVRALAANQAFMAASAAVWEQQLRETQSEDGTSSVTSWKDVTGADAERSKSDSDSTKQSEAGPAVTAAAPSSDATEATSPDTGEKAVEGTASSETSPATSVSAKCDPATHTPGESVLYEYVL